MVIKLQHFLHFVETKRISEDGRVRRVQKMPKIKNLWRTVISLSRFPLSWTMLTVFMNQTIFLNLSKTLQHQKYPQRISMATFLNQAELQAELLHSLNHLPNLINPTILNNGSTTSFDIVRYQLGEINPWNHLIK